MVLWTAADCKLACVRGIVVLSGPAVDRAAVAGLHTVPVEWCQQRQQRDGESFHITAFTKQDLQSIAQGLRDGSVRIPEGVAIPDAADAPGVAALAITMLQCRPSGLAWLDAGEGRASANDCEAAFRVVLWPGGAAARRELLLPPQDFHITLGFRGGDIHGRSKGVTSLVAGCGLVDVAALRPMLELARQLAGDDDVGVRALAGLAAVAAHEHGDIAAEVGALRLLCQLCGRQRISDVPWADEAVTYAQQLIELEQEEEFGWRSLAFALLALQRYEEAYPALQRLQSILSNLSQGDEATKVQDWLSAQLKKCRKKLCLASQPDKPQSPNCVLSDPCQT